MILNPQLLEKLGRFCSFRERCVKEVEDKLFRLGLDPKESSQYIDHLIELDVLNERRFVQAFVRGKFSVKSWGKKKISNALAQKGIDPSLVQEALSEFIDEENYNASLDLLIERKLPKIKHTDKYKRNASLVRYLQQKGFELNLIFERLNRIE